MNKRQRKKNKKKREEFVSSFVSSYKELKEFDRSYHEFVVSCNRMKNKGLIWDLDFFNFKEW